MGSPTDHLTLWTHLRTTPHHTHPLSTTTSTYEYVPHTRYRKVITWSAWGILDTFYFDGHTGRQSNYNIEELINATLSYRRS